MARWLFLCILFFSIGDGMAQLPGDTQINIQISADTLAKKIHPRWIKSAAITVGYAAATYTCYRFWDTRIQKTSQRTQNGFLTFISSSVSDFGLGKFQAISLSTTSIVAFVSKNKKLQRTFITWAGALLINSVVTEEVKKTFQRHRPNAGNGYNVFDWRKGSGVNRAFASAHTSNAFTTATIFATIYRDHEWVPYLAYGLAALVGASRIYDNEHWASDVMTGAAIGYLSAKAMNGIYKVASKKILFLPNAGLHGGSVSLVYQF